MIVRFFIFFLVLTLGCTSLLPVRRNPERDGSSAGGRKYEEQESGADEAGRTFLVMFSIGSLIYIIINEADKRTPETKELEP